MFKYKLGIEVEDKITGLRGILIGRAEHITGCDTYGLQPKVKDNTIVSSTWIDEGRIEVIKRSKNKITKKSVAGNKKGSCGIPQPTR